MYRKNNVPGDPASIPGFLDEELSQIERSQNSAVPILRLSILYAEPKVPSDPNVVLIAEADGTSWNPGAGAGTYKYRGGVWTKY